MTQIQLWATLTIFMLLGIMSYAAQGVASKILAFLMGILIFSIPKIIFSLLGAFSPVGPLNAKQICHAFYRAALIKWLLTLMGFGLAFSLVASQPIFVLFGYSFMTLLIDFILISSMSHQ